MFRSGRLFEKIKCRPTGMHGHFSEAAAATSDSATPFYYREYVRCLENYR
jgi:hypothetical protein